MKLFFTILLCYGFFNWLGTANASNLHIHLQGGENMIEFHINENGNQHNEGCLHGNGIMKKTRRDLKNFNKILVDGIFNLNIRQQKDFKVEVSCDENLYKYIQTQVVNGRLEINANKSICPKHPVDIHIGLPEFSELNAQGTDDIIITDLKNDKFLAIIDGSSDMKITGSTGQFTAKLNGSGDLDASGFHAEKVFIASCGAGDAIVHAAKEVNAVLDGAGDITYIGSPERIIQSGEGIGDLSAE